jgi:hypothetical protein
VQSFIEAYLEDVVIGLISAAVHSDESLRYLSTLDGPAAHEPVTATTRRLRQIT